MKNIYDAWLIEIDVTNVCIHKCSHCTRAVSHFDKPYFADLEFIEKALRSLKGWKKGVGCIGGEPTLHPQFPEICKLFKKYLPKRRRGLWTCGGKNYEKYKDLIDRTFGIINYNDHKIPSYHHPMLVASEEVIKDEQLRNELIDNCWLQLNWSPSVTVKGCFFCEVAATLDILFNGPGGYPIKPGWWKKTTKEFEDQRERYCRLCSIAIPMQPLLDNIDYEYVSKENAKRLKDSPLVQKGKIRIIDREYTREDLEKIKKSSSYRDPKKYAAELGTEHYWIRYPDPWNIYKIPHAIFGPDFKKRIKKLIKNKINKRTEREGAAQGGCPTILEASRRNHCKISSMWYNIFDDGSDIPRR